MNNALFSSKSTPTTLSMGTENPHSKPVPFFSSPEKPLDLDDPTPSASSSQKTITPEKDRKVHSTIVFLPFYATSAAAVDPRKKYYDFFRM